MSKTTSILDEKKVTIPWLIKNIPLPTWGVILGFLVTTFWAGARLGQTNLGRELFGTASETSSAPGPSMPQQEIQSQLAQLVEGHSQNLQKLYDSLTREEQNAGAATGITERDQHIDAADRLRRTLEDENAAFKSRIAELRTLSCGKE